VAATREAIFQNAHSISLSAPVIDAYASILSLDRAAVPSPATAPVRLAILNANDDTSFNEADLDLYLAHLRDNTGAPIEPLAPDYSRYDLNGDGFTGGATRTEAFDLDRVGPVPSETSTQFGAAQYSPDVTQTIEGVETHFDERHLTDLQILCYYAYSALYTGDPAARTTRLGGTCSVTVAVTPAQVSVPAGATQQFGATVRGTSDAHVTWTTDAHGSTISSTGLFTAGSTAGTFTVTATSVAEPNA